MTSRRVLITGSSRGIGAAIAKRLAQDGFAVTLHCRQKIAETEKLAQEIQAAGGIVACAKFDVNDRQICHDVLTQDVQQNGAYYGIVCNAGIARDNTFLALSEEDWSSVINTSLSGFYNVLQPLIMPLIRTRQGGRIVTLSSVSGMIGIRGQVNYSAAKAGIIGASKALAMELASRNITVNCVAPGLIETDMTNDVALEEALKHIPMNRVGKPEEVASLVSFLMSDEAAYITRQVISVNGGMV